MGKDFRIGLIAGLVLAGAALLWVATRPSLRPQAAEARHPDTPPAATEQHPPLPQNDAADGQIAGADLKPASASIAPVPVREATEPQPAVPVAADTAPQMSRPAPRPAPVAADGTHDLTIYESAEPIKTIKFHIVRKGETLSHIAQQYYGSKEQWRKILAANAKTVKDADKIAPGTKLILPD